MGAAVEALACLGSYSISAPELQASACQEWRSTGKNISAREYVLSLFASVTFGRTERWRADHVSPPSRSCTRSAAPPRTQASVHLAKQRRARTDFEGLTRKR